MSRIVALDYGLKRVGVAVTDPLRIIATPLITLRTIDTLAFLQNYVQQEVVHTFVVGLPKHLNNTASVMTIRVKAFSKLLQQACPEQRIVEYDERYTSKLALQGLIQGGFSKKYRRNKANLDQHSATLLLQSFLASTTWLA